MAISINVLLGLAGVSTGIGSLALQSQHYTSLRVAIDTGLERLETSMSHLQESLSSLTEVVLQSFRGLNVFFLQQGGLCAALGEECCFYRDHSGIVKDSLAKIRERLANRKREQEQNQRLFEKFIINPHG